MNEKQTTRPTKKQRELLSFIEAFIAGHGYSPTYREIMSGLNYNSVATVALHVGNLIKRGHLVKRDRSARSLEVVNSQAAEPSLTAPTPASGEQWLIEKIEQAFKEVETAGAELEEAAFDHLYVLTGALKVLGGPADSFISRLNALKTRASAELS